MRIPLLYGFIIGLASIGWSLLMYALGWDSSPLMRNFGFISVVILAIGLYAGIYAHRRISPNGLLDFADAFRTGIAITLLASMLGGMYSYYYTKNINPQLSEQIIAEKTETFKHFGASDDKIMRHTAWLRREYSPLGQMVLNGSGFILLGIFFSAIISVFLYQKSGEET